MTMEGHSKSELGDRALVAVLALTRGAQPSLRRTARQTRDAWPVQRGEVPWPAWHRERENQHG